MNAVVWSAAFAAAAALAVQPAHAQPTHRTGGRDAFVDGSVHVGLSAGYGVGFRMGSRANRRKSRELEQVRPVNVIPRVGIGLTDPIGGDAWYRGNVEMLVEGAFLINTEPDAGLAAGGGTTLRYNFLAQRNVIPFVDLNAGLLGVDFDFERQSDGFNFNVGAGAGTHWFLNESTAFTTEVRWQHISNAKTKRPNDGINDALFLAGLTVFFR